MLILNIFWLLSFLFYFLNQICYTLYKIILIWSSKMKEKIIQAIRDLDDEQALGLVREMLEATSDITVILDILNSGMEEIGKLYEAGTYYIADLIMAGYIYRCVLDMEEVCTFLEKKQNDAQAKGSIVICTVEGDIHDIGKDIFVSLARSKGFIVYDLGVDTKPEQILDIGNEWYHHRIYYLYEKNNGYSCELFP